MEIKTAPDGQLWFLTLDGKLSYLDQDSIIPFAGNEELDSLNNGNWLILGLNWDDQNRMIITFEAAKGYPNNYFRYDPATGSLVRLDFQSIARDYPVKQLFGVNYIDFKPLPIPELHQGEFIILPDGQFFLSRRKPGGVLYIGNVNSQESAVSMKLGNYVHEIFPEDNGRLWVCTNIGLVRLDQPWGSGGQKIFFEDYSVSNIGKDLNGNYWISTLDDGVRMIPSFQFEQPEPYEGQEEDQPVITLQTLGDHLIAGTMTGELISIDTHFVSGLIFQNPSYFGAFYHSAIGKDGALIANIQVSKTPDGLEAAPITQKKIGPLIAHLIDEKYFVMARTSHQVWDLKSGEVMRDRDEPARTGRIQCFLPTDTNIWAGSVKGLLFLDHLNGAKNLEFVDWGTDIEGQRVNDLKGNSKGVLFAATIGNGLVAVLNETTYRFGMEHGLASNMINEIALENDSTLWLATNKGLERLVLRIGESVELVSLDHISSRDGLPGNFIRTVALWRDQVWASTGGGLVYFDPQEILSHQSTIPHLKLKSIQVNRKTVSLDSTLDWSHDQNNVTIDFQAISYRKPIGVPFYRYRLLPRDSTWNYTDNRRVQYLGLPSGDYSFEVAARIDQYTWNETPTSFSFQIHPHYSQTRWFQVLLGLVIFLILAGIVFFRLRQLRIREARNRTLQEARLKAKEAELAALRNQMNPHFVFNALNSIQTFIFKNDVPQASYYLGRFAQLMRDGLEFSMQEYITLSEELAFLKAYLELEALRYPGEFTYQITLDEALEPDQVSLPPFLFQPILENAVKHGFKNISYPGVLEVKVELPTSKQLKVIIQDNGGGLDQAAKSDREKALQPSRGLMIVRNQIDLINNNQGKASFILQNREDGPGTEAIFTFIL